MIYNPDKREIILDRELSTLDKFVIDFINILKKYSTYVIVSGYVSIITGRSRATEDIDLLVEKIKIEDFEKLVNDLEENGFECLNTPNKKDAYKMLDEHAIRFAKKGKATPNIEFKIIKNDLDKYSNKNKIKIVLSDGEVFVSPLEMQIAYKLFLAADGLDEELRSDKDIEDARHLYKVFLEKINKEELLILIRKLNVENKFRFLE